MLQRIQSRDLLATWNAVGGPEIQQYYLTLQFLKSEGFSRKSLKLDIRHRLEFGIAGGLRISDRFRSFVQLQPSFSIWNPSNHLRTRKRRRLARHHENANENQYDAGNHLDLVQVLPEVLVKAQKLIDAQTC